MTGADHLVEQLRRIEEELRDLAYERLRAGLDGDPAALRDEKQVLKARRALERAIAALDGRTADDSDY